MYYPARHANLSILKPRHPPASTQVYASYINTLAKYRNCRATWTPLLRVCRCYLQLHCAAFLYPRHFCDPRHRNLWLEPFRVSIVASVQYRDRRVHVSRRRLVYSPLWRPSRGTHRTAWALDCPTLASAESGKSQPLLPQLWRHGAVGCGHRSRDMDNSDNPGFQPATRTRLGSCFEWHRTVCRPCDPSDCVDRRAIWLAHGLCRARSATFGYRWSLGLALFSPGPLGLWLGGRPSRRLSSVITRGAR